MLDRTLLQVVQHLIARRVPRTRDRRDLFEIRNVEVAHAPGQDLAGPDQCVEGLDRFLQGMGTAPVKQVAIQPVGSQARQGFLACRESAPLRGIARQDLGDEEDFIAPAGDRLCDDPFRGPRAVHFRGIDMSQAEIETAAQGSDGRGRRRCLYLPGSLADRRNTALSAAECACGGGHGLLREHGVPVIS